MLENLSSAGIKKLLDFIGIAFLEKKCSIADLAPDTLIRIATKDKCYVLEVVNSRKRTARLAQCEVRGSRYLGLYEVPALIKRGDILEFKSPERDEMTSMVVRVERLDKIIPCNRH